MLSVLRVKNLALIDEAVFEAQSGFVCLTGETGAGKSLIVDALSLLTGARASSDLIRSGTDRLSVEAEFDIRDQGSDLDLLDGPILFLRRELTPNGRSRSFVNGVAVPNAKLGPYARLAFEIYGQNGQQSLLRESLHLGLYDTAVGLDARAEQCQRTLSSFKQAWHDYWSLIDQQSQRLKEMDFLTLQIAEIEQVGINADDDDLERRLKRARNHALITQQGQSAIDIISVKLTPALHELKSHISSLAPFDEGLPPYLEQLETLEGVIQELERDVRRGVGDDGHVGDLSALEARQSQLNTLFLKYGRNLEEVQQEYTGLKQRLKSLQAQQSDLGHARGDLSERYRRLRKEVNTLDRARRKAEPEFVNQVTSQLRALSFPDACFELEAHWAEWPEELENNRAFKAPTTRLRFLFSPNPGETAKPLARIASGGELSRIMLALITSLHQNVVKTLVFDEVDAGIGGETAIEVGNRLRSLGQGHQVLCVTHLAQVAGFADQHVTIQKHVSGQRTFTTLTDCNKKQRIAELARLMGGDADSASLRQHARAMVERSVR